jgi:hypothetical protein
VRMVNPVSWADVHDRRYGRGPKDAALAGA